MEEEKTQEHDVEHAAELKKPKGVGKKRLKFVLSALVLVALVAVSALYFNEKSRANDLASELAAESEKVAQAEAKTAEAPAEVENTCEGGSSYTADVGEYTLDLPTDYVIINNLDAGFEGGPATSLDVGACDDSGTNVVDNYTATELNLFTNAASGPYSPVNPGITTDLDPLTVDEIEADVYLESGLFAKVIVVVDHGDLRTVISATGTDEDSILSGPLSDVIDNIAFE